MKLLQIVMLLVLSTALGLSVFFTADVRGQNPSRQRGPGSFDDQVAIDLDQDNGIEAPTGFDNKDNGFAPGTHDADRGDFEQVEQVADGLGPVYNAQSCSECHQNPVSGAISQVTELRAGHLDHGKFFGATVVLHDANGNEFPIVNRSLINLRAICPSETHPQDQAEERVPDNENIRTLRTSLNTLGDGFVEAIPDDTLKNFSLQQCKRTHGVICGQAIPVAVAESPGTPRIGRFGWKDQDASLLTFSGGAYLNEMGITNRLFPNEVTKLCDDVPDPEDVVLPGKGGPGDQDIDHFARFMRASKAPPRDAHLAATFEARQGAEIFKRIGCQTCHVGSIVTAAPNKSFNPGDSPFTVGTALGNKTIHPFSDFLLHNVGTGDGIVQTDAFPETARKMRTAPLWGVRMRAPLMHDGLSLTFTDAILRHGGEAAEVTENFRNLTPAEKQELITFLKSL